MTGPLQSAELARQHRAMQTLIGNFYASLGPQLPLRTARDLAAACGAALLTGAKLEDDAESTRAAEAYATFVASLVPALEPHPLRIVAEVAKDVSGRSRIQRRAACAAFVPLLQQA